MPIKGINAIEAKLSRLANDLGRIAPKRVAADAERWFKQSFRDQGFTDRSLVKWPRTKNGKPGTILRKTGLLFNSIRIARADAGGIQIVAGGPQVPYARIHNEGGTIEGQVTVRTHVRRASVAKTRRGRIMRKAAVVRSHQRQMLIYMAKRQYMGRSVLLDKKMRDTVSTVIAEALRDR